MIPLPSVLATPLRVIVAIVALVAIGAGGVIGWRWWRNRDEKQAVESKPAIIQNQRQIDTATATNVLRSGAYHTAAGGFRKAAAAANNNPTTTPATRACYDAGIAVISRCDSLHTSDSTLIALYRKRADLMEGEAVRARRGRLVQITAAGGWDPTWGAPAARAGAELNFSDHWSLIGTHDFAVKLKRDSTGRVRIRQTEFIGLNYRFGGRNP